ncbi:anaphase-promoting complex subunit 4 [Lucilia cuprina]|uniref:anaphase-promoting complex subunit 4 n=1 Tax=Lucilia cuprina TaxID=7375 RepID=UPI001F05E647|nr:anaphase-promoting complex subunit 4 [Lucilia cuprina]XP_046802678.1 anaphase-promoting complex subunit 4 [Lucilia cuprina]XP_046802679.1 anaphase-promoting complex subunit 4 [Lucilia cuprina]
MSQSMSMKQIGARHMSCVIEIMEWSNKMDLVAYGTEKGEIVIQRLNWQKIVTFPSPGEGVKVRSLSWQYDETIIAVGYSNGQVSLLDVEREESVSNLVYDDDIKKVYFSKAINAHDYRQLYRNKTELTYDFFLPPLPHLSSLGVSSKTEEHKTFAKGSPCFLVVILKCGKVHLLLLGALKSGAIDMSQHVSHPDELVVHDVRLSGDFNAMYALLRDGNQLKILHFHNTVLKEYISPMIHLAQHCANILETKNYIDKTIQCILEAWETVLLEMDNKLTSYANKQTEGSLSADFMELLVFGYATHEIEEFLMQDLTEKGVKKLQNSVDLSYSTIQSLVSKPLQMASINMFYFLNTIKGLARISYYYEPLIVCESTEAALRECGAFLMKVLELQQVIDQSVNDMKLFFCWLCVVIVRLHQQDVTEDMAQLSMEDTIYLAEYLNSFEDSVIENDDGTVIKRKFNLEKVGQYLEDKPLQQVVKTDMHHLWHKLLEENECLRNSTLLYPHEKRLSLTQQRDKMFAAIDSVFQKPNESISHGFELDASFVCCSFNENSECNFDFIRTSYFVSESKKRDLMLVTIGWQDCLVLEFDDKFTQLKCFRLQTIPGPFTKDLTNGLENLKFVDLHFYNNDVLSLLLFKESETMKHQSYFIQFPLDQIAGKCSLHTLPQNINLNELAVGHSIFDIIDITSFKAIESVCTNLAVSGCRKVASILSEKRKKMIIFEMEIEDDEDETEISQNSMLDISKESAVS